MKPFRIFLFGLSVFLVLYIVSALFAEHPPTLFGYTIKIPIFTLSPPKSSQYKDISHILNLSKLITDTTNVPATDTLKSKKALSQSQPKGSILPKSSLKADSIRYLLRDIEYPKGQDSILFPFFRELNDLANNDKLIHIIHYGDSQIEGDRITSYLRNQLQMQFGGNGIGLLPIVSNNPASMSYVYEVSDNWARISPLQPSSEDPHFNKYGALLNYARLKNSSSLFGTEKEMKGWINLKHSNLSYPLTQNFQHCRIFYGYNNSPMMVDLKRKNEQLDAEFLPASSALKVFQWTIEKPLNDITITFRSNESPCIFGIALDGKQGIAVDNVPLRGSSGLEFTKTDMPFLHSFYKLLNVKLLILQFGVNIVPNVTENYAYYERSFLQQLNLLKKYNPEISIIVIGVSDVSRNGKDGFESYPNIEKIRNAQKMAAFEAGCAFWDIFEAMGGRNSMPSWVFADPPLAQKDFIHFNPIGAKIIGEMFYRSFIHEYNKFLEIHKVTNN